MQHFPHLSDLTKHFVLVLKGSKRRHFQCVPTNVFVEKEENIQSGYPIYLTLFLTLRMLGNFHDC